MKRLQPIDSLTKQDKYNFRKYLFLYANCNCGPLEEVLQEWNKSKRKLYRAFGNQLTVKKSIHLPQDEFLIESKLRKIYSFWAVYNETDIPYLRRELRNQNNFYSDFVLYFLDDPNISFQEKKNITDMFRCRYISDGYIDYEFKLEHYSFSVQKGAKTIRTIQKCMKALGYDNTELFNKWRNQINTVNSNRFNEVNLVISINPVDFITMSDNACKWSSCMSWINNGCYHAGTIEMMNSNLAAVAYIEAENPFRITLDEDNELVMSNKSWRSLIFCHKDIILVGKSYPYYNEVISKEVAKFMRDLVKENLNWNYQFELQRYQDIKGFHKNSFLKFDCEPNYYPNSKKIVIYTKGMYNDFIEDTLSDYWCCRNSTKKGLRLCLSGKHTCMCCGKVIDKKHETFHCEPEDISKEKLCYDCRNDKKCPVCGIVNYDTDNEYHLCSEECKKDAIIFSGQNRVISKTKFLSYSDISLVLISKDEKTYKKIHNIINKLHFGEQSIRVLPKFMELELEEENLIKGRDYIIKKVPKILFNENIVEHNYLIKSRLYSCKMDYIYYGYYVKPHLLHHWYYNDKQIGYIFSDKTLKLIEELQNINNYHSYL